MLKDRLGQYSAKSVSCIRGRTSISLFWLKRMMREAVLAFPLVGKRLCDLPFFYLNPLRQKSLTSLPAYVG